MVANPVSSALSWALQTYLGMPQPIADSLAVVLGGLVVGILAYYVPNVVAGSTDTKTGN